PRVDGWPASADVLGPVPVGHDDSTPAKERVRALIRVPRADGRALADVLRAAIAVRTARKEPDQIRVRLDPVELM
ncbi:MAG: hypothetical protein J2P17_31915, partial [Mycobacterium sp.]|nr:hypothetical protein [Mycobacterium sp.]